MTSLATRFWKKVNKTEGCWLWTGAQDGRGYGQICRGGRTVDDPRDSVPLKAHRVSWEIHFGPIPAGFSVLHRCDIRCCVRPDHLFLGDAAANMADMMEKGRNGQPRGMAHPRRKLSLTQVEEIRRKYAAGGTSTPRLAREYGMGKSQIWKIVNRLAWE